MAQRLNRGWKDTVLNLPDYYIASIWNFENPPQPARIVGEGHPAELPPPTIQSPYGTNGADTLAGGGAGDRLLGLQGNDQLFGGAGNDSLFGLAGNDTLHGDDADDSLYGDSGNDILYGGAGSDFLYGDRNAAPALLSSAAQEVVDRIEARIGAADFAIIYQGSSYNAASLTAADHDMIIINPARIINTDIANGETLWMTSEVNGIEGSGKALLGYLNVAKINDWVGYWSTTWTSNGRWNGTDVPGQAPAYLGGIDGAFTRDVKFWESGWLQVLFDRVDTIIAKGFSGIFLDDVLQYYDNPGISIAEGARVMRDLVTAVAGHARAVAGDSFTIVINGAPEIIVHGVDGGNPLNTVARDAYYASLDAILVENYFSGGDGRAVAIVVNEFGSRGIALLSADTNITTPQQRFDIEEAAVTAGFLPETTAVTDYSENSSRFLAGSLIPPAGSDVLDGGSGADQMHGGSGDDSYFVDNALDTAVEAAGQGFDVVWSTISYVLAAGTEIEALSARFWEDGTAISLTGNAFNNNIYGNAGANALDGGGGNDVLFGMAGNDSLTGGAGADLMYGGAGDDFYFADNGLDGAGETAGQGYDVIWTSVTYILAAGTQIEALSTRFWEDTSAINLTGNEIGNALYGNAGANSLDGGGGNDTLYGFEGNDQLTGGAGLDILYGGTGDDNYFVDNAADVVLENAGLGFDIVWATASFTLVAGSEVEALSSRFWEDTNALSLTGNEIANTLYGNAGANVLDGRGGGDSLFGFGGADSFRFSTALGGGNIDTIAGFVAVDDTIQLDDAVFTALAPGALNANAFVTGTAALDADDRIIYNNATGALYYDADGSGSGAAVQFATLQGAPIISASDFMVI